MNPRTSVIVGPSPLKILVKVAIASIALTAGMFILVVFVGFLTDPSLLSYARIITVCTAALATCYCGIAVLGAIIWRRPRVEIGPDGFVDHGIVGQRSRCWSDIEGRFTVIRVGLQSTVAYHLTDAFKEIARIKPIPSLAGNDEAILICGELAISARELAELLNQWKQGVESVASPHGGRTSAGG